MLVEETKQVEWIDKQQMYIRRRSDDDHITGQNIEKTKSPRSYKSPGINKTHSVVPGSTYKFIRHPPPQV